MRSTAITLALLVLLPAVPLARACEPTTSPQNVCLRTGPGLPWVSCATVYAGPYYVVYEPGQVTLFNVWFYEETNGIPGLQRADEVHDDTCGGVIPGDSIAF